MLCLDLLLSAGKYRLGLFLCLCDDVLADLFRLLASFLDDGGVSSAVGTAKYDLGQAHKLVDTINRKRIHIWVYA